MSNTPATGSAQTPGDQANQNGQQDGAQDTNDDTLDPNAGGDAGGDGAGGDGGAGGDQGGGDGGDAGDGGQGQGQGGNRRAPSERIAEVVAERNAAMDYGRYWYDQAMQLMGKGGQPGGGQGAPAAGGAAPGAGAAAGAGTAPPAKAPQLKDFNFDVPKWQEAHDAWVEARIDHGVTTRVESRLTAREQQQEQQQVSSSWATRCAEFRANNPDFDQVVLNPTLPVTKEMSDVIMRSEVGPAVYHYLGKNPTEAARISRQSPENQKLAIARLEGRLAATQAAGGGNGGGGGGGNRGGQGQQRGANGQFQPGQGQQRQQSGAPPPPTRTAAGGGDVPLEQLSLDDYVLARMKQRAGK